MQIIQSIRDKGAAITITVIALALIAFILMDAKSGSNNMANSRSTSLGKVNGKSIGVDEFNKRVTQQELQQKQQSQGAELSNLQKNQIKEQVWNLMVDERVFYTEADKLGIDFTSKELTTILSSKDQNNPVLREITDENTGDIDPTKLKQVLSTIKKAKGDQKDAIDAQIIDPQRLTSVSTKYYALLSSSAYYPSWMEEADKKESKEFANISYVNIPYNVISDSTIKVSDEEIAKYVEQHKENFKQEAGRMVSYVAFSQLPSSADSAKIREAITALKNEFATTDNIQSFVARHSTASFPYDSTYKPKSLLRTAFVDSIVNTPINSVYGPFVEGKNYLLSKVLSTKMMPDSIRARHILIPTVDPQSGQPITEDSVAHNRADSIFAAIKAGADFGAMAKQFSSDGSKDKGGDLGYFGYGQMVPEFNDFSFTKPVGSRDVVRTQFGYHIIEVVSQKGMSPAYRIAFIAKEIMASDATMNNASLEANKVSAEKDAKKLDAYIKKNGLQKIDIPNIVKENDYQIGNIQDARQVINWIYTAKVGDVSEPFSVKDEFVVMIVNKIYKKGTQDVQTARPLAENSVREEKKAAEILKKLGATPTLETAAAAYGKQVMVAGGDSTLTFSAVKITDIGPEPKVIGASFNPAYRTKVSPAFAGKTGVYILKVNSIGTKPADTPEAAAAIRSEKINNLRMAATNQWYNGLKDQANIKDKRSETF